MKKIYMLMLIACLMSSCKDDDIDQNNCLNLVCTDIFASVTIKFVDKDGSGITVTDFKVINSRTGERIMTNNPNAIGLGVYAIIDDASLLKVSNKGDNLTVSAKNPINNVQKQIDIKIKGGKCNCHVEKISGPEQLIME